MIEIVIIITVYVYSVTAKSIDASRVYAAEST